MAYAKGKRALGICDRCGFQTKLNTMIFQPTDGRMTSVKVCRSCLDIDNEQWQLRLLDLTDNEALLDPRPDIPDIPGPVIQWGTELPLEWGAYALLRWG